MFTVRFSRGRACPYLKCAACSRPIDDWGLAVVQLFRDGHVRIVHKNLHGRHCDDKSNDEGWLELETFFHYLLRNGRFSAKRARHKAEALEVTE